MSNVKNILSNCIVEKTTTVNNESKTRAIQQLLKSTDFSDRKIYAKYNNVCNLFIRELEKFLNDESNADNEKSVSKKSLLEKLNLISNFLRYENLEIDNKTIEFKNYHINFIINHSLILKINPDKSINDNIKSESAIKKLIEQCFYYTIDIFGK